MMGDRKDFPTVFIFTFAVVLSCCQASSSFLPHVTRTSDAVIIDCIIQILPYYNLSSGWFDEFVWIQFLTPKRLVPICVRGYHQLPRQQQRQHQRQHQRFSAAVDRPDSPYITTTGRWLAKESVTKPTKPKRIPGRSWQVDSLFCLVLFF